LKDKINKMNYLKKIIYLFGDKKISLLILFFFFLLSSFIEIIGLSFLGTYIAYIINPENILIENITKYLSFLDQYEINKFTEFKFFSYSIIVIFLIKFILLISLDLYIEHFTLNRARILRNNLLKKYIKDRNENIFSQNTSSYVETIL